jgi:hypothetical protein
MQFQSVSVLNLISIDITVFFNSLVKTLKMIDVELNLWRNMI